MVGRQPPFPMFEIAHDAVSSLYGLNPLLDNGHGWECGEVEWTGEGICPWKMDSGMKPDSKTRRHSRRQDVL